VGLWLRPIVLVLRSAATGAVLHSSREPGELSQLSKQDDNSIKIIVVTIFGAPAALGTVKNETEGKPILVISLIHFSPKFSPGYRLDITR